ncbi:synaptogenesis protein syg-2 isoform X2 [Hermetia illucens]|uniref:synaptogenesis protein syg-2 isoform X2 n=1 Tax=Hermetia illucens TaxID=343691 RepID=UPI0018CC5C6A|nr:synaptogenesis protein syg-2 isoform X2 [Hermetia illucens]
MKSMEPTLRILFYVISLVQYITSYEHGDGHKQDGETLRVLVNGTAQIKCDVSSNLQNDQVLLVVWYKNNLPIYSYDTRGAHAETPSHWRDPEVLEERALFRTVREPAELIINPVLEKDAGNFRCRVDFKLSQTRNSNVNLEIVVPPQPPKIFNDRGELIDTPRAGPYEEGGDLHLICVVMGGSPPPTITWSMNGQVLPSTTLDYSYPSALNSKLVVRNLSRIHQHAVYTCQASNFHKKVVSTNLTIDLYLRPLMVDISFNNQPMSADRKYEIECQAIGSRPPAKITWWMGKTELHAFNQKVSADGNVSLSILALTPTREDHGKVLICRATNELVKNGVRETSMKLNVFYIPTIQLDLGSNLNPEDIEEGDDVYFECKVNANPAAYKVIWKHNNQVIQHNSKVGVIVSNGDLALQGITRHQAGNYTCTASNVEGDGDSNVVELRVMYKPICRPDQKKIYGVARNEAVEITCEVDAYPPPETFKWSFNNTAETFDMPQSGFRIHSAQASTLTYKPVKEMDFGTIMCWADNVVGQQSHPCVFHLIAAGKPDSPYNCSLVNQTSESLEVECSEGFDGGLRQWFIMEIFEEDTGILQANVSSRSANLSANDLDAGKLLKIFIYAANVKGRSEAVTLEGFTLKPAEKQTGSLNNSFELTPILSIGIFIGIITALLCIALATVAALKFRSSKQQQKYQQQKGKAMTFSRPGNLPIKDKISLPLSHSEEMYDEKNPDVVPYNGEAEYKLKSATQTPSGLNISRTSESDLLASSNEERKVYNQKSQNDELHYAELALAVSKSSIEQQCNNAILSSSCSGTLVKKTPAYDYFDEPTIYAQIDHYKAAPVPQQSHPPLVSPPSQSSLVQTALPHNHCSGPGSGTASVGVSPNSVKPIPLTSTAATAKPFSREIVTVRTPILYTQQESCV